ncbi:unnamed protein product, partial [Effrenium voratum]
EGAEVRACRSTWLIDSMLAQNAEDIAERCPHVVSAMGWPYLEADAQILWHQSNNNPEYELAEVSAAFSEVLQRSIQ